MARTALAVVDPAPPSSPRWRRPRAAPPTVSQERAALERELGALPELWALAPAVRELADQVEWLGLDGAGVPGAAPLASLALAALRGTLPGARDPEGAAHNAEALLVALFLTFADGRLPKSDELTQLCEAAEDAPAQARALVRALEPR